MKMLLAASLLAASLLPAAPATAGACVHDHLYNGDHGGSPHVHYPQCHDNSPDDRPRSRADQHRRDTEHRPAQQQLPACVHVNEDLSVDVHNAECTDIADGPSTGGCSVVAVTDSVAGEGQMTGVIDVEAVVYSTDPTDNPASATFTCYVKVNGATQPGAIVSASGTGAVAGGGFITYTSNSSADFVQLCEDVSYSNPNYADTSECFEAESFEIPPPFVWEIVDGALCPAYEALAGSYGPVVIGPCYPARSDDPGGDVYLDGEMFSELQALVGLSGEALR